jgi:hypothetical protein
MTRDTPIEDLLVTVSLHAILIISMLRDQQTMIGDTTTVGITVVVTTMTDVTTVAETATTTEDHLLTGKFDCPFHWTISSKSIWMVL